MSESAIGGLNTNEGKIWDCMVGLVGRRGYHIIVAGCAAYSYSHRDSFKLIWEQKQPIMRINRMKCSLEEADLPYEIVETSAFDSVRSCHRWPGYPDLFVAEIIVNWGGTKIAVIESDLFVFDTRGGKLKPVIRTPWVYEQGDDSVSTLAGRVVRFARRLYDQWHDNVSTSSWELQRGRYGVDYHFGRSKAGNPMVWDSETLESWEILPHEVIHSLPQNESKSWSSLVLSE